RLSQPLPLCGRGLRQGAGRAHRDFDRTGLSVRAFARAMRRQCAGAGGVMSPPLIEIRNVERRFRLGGTLFGGGRDLRAVNGVSLSVRKGEVLGIVGEPGCRQSALPRMLRGLLAPSAGEILFDGQAVGSLDSRALA